MYQNENIEKYRLQTDAQADAVVASINTQGGMQAVRVLMSFLVDFKDFNSQNQPVLVQEFIAQTALPAWADLKKIERATIFYKKHQVAIGISLGCYALPYCYLGADGAQVLAMTERIKKDTYNRLLETGEFVNGVMNWQDWTAQKQNIRIAKIRLMHACVRHFVLYSKTWNDAWGRPVNQEDMAGTNLAFSFIVLRGLRKMGIVVSEVDEDAYLHTWNAVGAMMGVDEAIIPHSIALARRLDDHIVKRNFRASQQGVELTAALIKSIRKIQPIPFLRDLPVAQTRLLLGNKYADMLGVPTLPIHATVVKLTNGFGSIIGRIRTILD